MNPNGRMRWQWIYNQIDYTLVSQNDVNLIHSSQLYSSLAAESDHYMVKTVLHLLNHKFLYKTKKTPKSQKQINITQLQDLVVLNRFQEAIDEHLKIISDADLLESRNVFKIYRKIFLATNHQHRDVRIDMTITT